MDDRKRYLEGFGMVANALRVIQPRLEGWHEGVLKVATSDVLRERPVLGGWDIGRREAWLAAWGF